MNLLDNIYGVLFRPKTTFPELSNRQYLGHSFLIVFMLALLTSLKNSVVYNSSGFSVSLLLVITFIMYLFIWVISGVFLTFTADLFGGAGKVTDTMIGTAHAALPLILASPLYMLTSPLGNAGENLYSLLRVMIYIWSLVLLVLSIKYSHRFHTTQAILSFISVFILMVIFGVGMATVSVLGTIFAITSFA